MVAPIALTAVLTGVFCAVFAVGVSVVTEALSMTAVIVVSFVSGFLGSLFAQLVMGKTS